MVRACSRCAIFEFLVEIAGNLGEFFLLVAVNRGLGIAKSGDNGEEDREGEDNDERAEKDNLPAEAQTREWMTGRQGSIHFLRQQQVYTNRERKVRWKCAAAIGP